MTATPKGYKRVKGRKTIFKKVKCPTCGKGWDTDGDGNCPNCAFQKATPKPPRKTTHDFTSYKWGHAVIWQSLSADPPESAREARMLVACQDEIKIGDRILYYAEACLVKYVTKLSNPRDGYELVVVEE